MPFICNEFGLAASKNLLSDRSGQGELQKWYLTKRNYGTRLLIARDEFIKLIDQIHQYLPIKNMDMECVIYDTYPDLDKGWIS